MKLRSIPPANRIGPSRMARLSSMRAADRAGQHLMVFVGRAEPRQAQSDEIRARIVHPDGQAQRERQAFQQAWAARVRQIEALLADAATLAETAFWQGELERLGILAKGEG